MIRQWEEFITIESRLDPLQMKNQLEQIEGLTITNELLDITTEELHLNFTYKNFKFAMHNPYSGAYGYWFFYHHKNNDRDIIEKLSKLLQELDKNKDKS